MAPVKPMGVGDPNESTARGVTGFHQQYNQESSPVQELNPDAVVKPADAPKPAKAAVAAPVAKPASVRKSTKK